MKSFLKPTLRDLIVFELYDVSSVNLYQISEILN